MLNSNLQVGANKSSPGFLARGGEMGERMRGLDWSLTALGPIELWPQSLRTAVSICLNSRFPMILWWGPQLTVLYNDGYIPVLGTKHPERALGLPGHEVWAEVWPVIEPLLRQVMEKGEANWADDMQLFLNRSGYPEECYFRFSYSPISDESGGIGGVFTPVSDTTQRVVAERRLRTLRELAERSNRAQTVERAYASAAETLAENPYDIPFAAIYQVTQDGQEAHLAATAGIAPGSPVTPDIIQLHTADDSPVAEAARRGGVQTLSHLELLNALPPGPWGDRPSAVVIHPVTKPIQGEAESFLLAGVSARKHLDDEYCGFLEMVAKQMGTALAAARAYEDEKQRAEALAELDRAKTAFFSNVSHEFRTPLTLMLAPLEEVLSAAGELPSKLAGPLKVAHRNALRLQKLVNTLLDFSRIEAGRMQASFEATDLAEYTADLASTFRSVMENAGLTFVIDCPPLSEPVWIDREMWEKVVLNLLSNAFKYTLEGSVVIRMREAGGCGVISVSDTGIGISEEELPRLFERFHRVENEHGRTQEGTGIGLALVAELVKMHGGAVSVESQPRAGSTFTVSLPLGSAHLPLERLTAPRPHSFQKASVASYVEEAGRWLPDRQCETEDAEKRQPAQSLLPSPPEETEGFVLLADDNADMRDYVGKLLRKRYEVETACNGNEALNKALEKPPDLVLADVMMPELDGFELLKALRASSITKNIPVILLSARAGEESRSEGMDAGADDYLVKPFTARELTARVGAHLRLSRLRKRSEKREAELRAEAEAARDRALDVLESITDGFFTLDKDWCFTYVNSTGERLLGATFDELRGKNHWDLYPSSVGTLAEHEYRRAVDEGRSVEFEIFYAPWQKWFAVKAYPTTTGGLSIYFRDITHNKQAAEALHDSEKRFRELADNISQFAWMAEASGNVFWFNKRWHDYTGTTLEETQGWGWQTVHHPDHVRRVTEGIKRCFESGQVWEDTFPLRDKDGRWRWFLSRARPIHDQEGKIVRWFGTNTDITEQLETQEELRRANQDLEQFAFSASHDLQEPLRTMAVHSQLLQRRYASKLDADAEVLIKRVVEGSQRMSEMVSDLLAYLHAASIDDGPVEPVDTEAVLGEALSSLGNSIRESKAEVTHDALPQIAVNPIHLHQLLQNLIGNALKYRKDGERPRVHISASPVGPFRQFAIKDNGIGIEPRFHKQVFGVFKRLHARNGKYSGTGVGLAICQRIVERYGGRIWLESEPDRGTTFYFTVPAIAGAGRDVTELRSVTLKADQLSRS
jgi:PAS domain S-box-containing protein